MCHAHLGGDFVQQAHTDVAGMLVRDGYGDSLCLMEVDGVLALAHGNISGAPQFSLKLIIANWLELATHGLQVNERKALRLRR